MADMMLETGDLAQCKLFQGLSNEELALFYKHGDITHHAPGDILVHEGYRWEKLYVILQGDVEIFLPKTDQRFSKVTLTTLETGQAFGEFSFIDSKPASASVATSHDSTLYSIAYDALSNLLEQNDQLGRLVYKNLLVVLVDKLRTSNKELDVLVLS